MAGLLAGFSWVPVFCCLALDPKYKALKGRYDVTSGSEVAQRVMLTGRSTGKNQRIEIRGCASAKGDENEDEDEVRSEDRIEKN